ncbi:MAG TPA: LTA synthase family protein, partial [Candidatus Nitrosocosmicus sp.]|nr:LTA synthase family protein [Candidatus Nitrosocosmicus sp.]
MFTFKKYPYLLLQAVLMTALTLCKYTALYYSVGKPQNMLLAALRSTLLLLSVYILINLIIARKHFALRLILHESLAVVILADLLYYKYFNVLPSARDLQFLKVLPTIWDSVSSLFSPVYLLLFVDAFLLAVHHFYAVRQEKPAVPKLLPSLAALTIMLALVSADFSLSRIKSSGQVYEEFGLLHYHISQLAYDSLVKSDIIKSGIKKPVEVQSKKPVKDPRLFGIAKGRNVIVIQVEALQDFVINLEYNGQKLTPNLNKLLLQDSIYFNRYYQQLGKGGTSDAEFVSQNSLYPSMDLPAYSKYQNNKFMGLPMIMREKGYNTMAFHAYKPEFWNRQNIYPMLGYDRFVNMHDFSPDEIFGWGLSDKHFFRQSARILSTAKQPYYSFLITLSSHHPYALPKKYKTVKLLPEHENTKLGNYIQAIRYADEALGLFFDELRKYGMYKDSLIAIYGDHRGIPNGVPENDKLMSKLLGHEYTFDEALNVPLIIHIPGSGVSETNIMVGGQMDFLPTMLNLLGIKESRVKLFGQDLLNAESGFVASQSNMIKGSFIDDYKIFIMSRDGVFEHSKAWDLSTREPVDLELCRDGYERALRDIQQSEYILANDLIQEFVKLGEANTTFGSAFRATSDFMDKLVQLFNR